MRSLAVRVRNLVVPLVAIVAVWQLASSIAIVNPVLFPSPAKVLLAAIDMFRSGVLLKDLLVSLQRAAAGFVVGASLGVTLGLLTSRVRLFSIGLSPLFNLLRPIPAIALVPIAVVWFGIGEES
ncbi:ABC transporter permease, partial [Bradyrhizobium sp.]